MDKVTKKEVKEFLKYKLGTDYVWAIKGLLKIFENQTLDEQKSKHTKYHNGIGFNGTDGEILSSFALQFRKKRRLSDKQMTIVYKKMPKYWNQILSISDEDHLHKLIRS
jgi:hypothetical protein